MKFPLPSVPAIRALIRHQSAYVANPDPAAKAANTIALILAWNGPFYPLYVLFLIGRDALPGCLLTLLVSPFFYAIPWLSRRSSRAGRVALPLVGAINTVWCMKLFGPASGVGLFLYPCLILPALLFRPRERWLMLPLLGFVLLLQFLPTSIFGAPIMGLPIEEAAHLYGLNAGSVACLLAVIALQFANVLRAESDRATPLS